MPPYLIYSQIAKWHICETETIYETVMSDLHSRGADDLDTTQSENDAIHIDFGGVILSNARPHCCNVNGIEVSFFVQHYSLVRLALELATLRDGYYKVHGERCYCLTPETMISLRTYLNEKSHLLQVEEDAKQDLSDRIAKVLAAQQPSPNDFN